MQQLKDALQAPGTRDVVVLLGAGASTGAGIPDFRGDQGIYQQFGVDRCEDLFRLSAYRRNPKPFAAFARWWMGLQPEPTKVHRFLRWLDDRARLLHVFTQNLDGLELDAGVHPSRVSQFHGNLDSASCTDCHLPCNIREWKQTVGLGNDPPRCVQCNGWTKPDIVFFGEAVRDAPIAKMTEASIVIVIGTSLQVAPFRMLPSMAPNAHTRVALDLRQVDWDGDTLVGDASETCQQLMNTPSVTVPTDTVQRFLVNADMAADFFDFCFGDNKDDLVLFFAAARRKYFNQDDDPEGQFQEPSAKRSVFLDPKVERASRALKTVKRYGLDPVDHPYHMNWCVLYTHVNLRSTQKALQLMHGELLTELQEHGKYNDRTGFQRFESCARRKASAVKCRIYTIDADSTEECNVVDAMLKFYQLQPHGIVDTQGGRHYLLALDRLSQKEKQTFFKTVVGKLGEAGVTCDPDMSCPVPGTLQAGKMVRWTRVATL